MKRAKIYLAVTGVITAVFIGIGLWLFRDSWLQALGERLRSWGFAEILCRQIARKDVGTFIRKRAFQGVFSRGDIARKRRGIGGEDKTVFCAFV